VSFKGKSMPLVVGGGKADRVEAAAVKAEGGPSVT
jgi:hypothetical protein